jgi:hypothetical protein
VDFLGQFGKRRQRQRDAQEDQQQAAPTTLQQAPGATPECRRMGPKAAPVVTQPLAPDQAVSPP